MIRWKSCWRCPTSWLTRARSWLGQQREVSCHKKVDQASRSQIQLHHHKLIWYVQVEISFETMKRISITANTHWQQDSNWRGGGITCPAWFFLQLSKELTEHVYLLNHLQSSQKTWPWKDPRQIFLAPNDGQCLFESGYAGWQQGGYEYIRRPSPPRPCSVYANLNPTVGARCVQAEKKTNNWK